MNEVEKMYENAEPNRDCNLYKHFTECPMKHTQCEDCEHFVYPSFTAEKQLKLIEILSYKALEIGRSIENDYFYIQVDNRQGVGVYNTLEEALAGLINNLWQDLTDAEKQQVKGILE